MAEEEEARTPDVPGLGIAQEIGPWQAHMEWPADMDQGGPWYMTIRPNPSASPEELAGGLSSTVLRQVDFRQAADKWREVSAVLDTEKAEAARQLANLAGDLSVILRENITEGINDRYLAWLAFAYVTLVKRGEKSVTANLAELVRRRPETIRAHLKLARSHGLLTTIRGRAGGHLTPEAEEIIRRTAQAAEGEG